MRRTNRALTPPVRVFHGVDDQGGMLACLLKTFDPICLQALGYERLANGNRISRPIAVRMLLCESLHLLKKVILQFFHISRLNSIRGFLGSLDG